MEWAEAIVLLLGLLVLYLGWRYMLRRTSTNMYEQTAELTEIRDNLRNQLWGDD
jgi:Tfp pilus assembly protein PilO